MLISHTNRISINPKKIPIIITPSPKKLFKIDSIEEMIHEGALKKERA